MLGIYKITNKKTGKFYIGSSKNIFDRIKIHCQLLKKGKHANKKFQDEMREFNIKELSFEVLENCHISHLNVRENFWIKELKAVEQGYNQIENKIKNSQDIKLTVNPFIIPYLKKSFKNIVPDIKDPSINIIDDETFEFLLKLFSNDIELLRPREEILVIPNQYKSYRKPPFIYICDDFGL